MKLSAIKTPRGLCTAFTRTRRSDGFRPLRLRRHSCFTITVAGGCQSSAPERDDASPRRTSRSWRRRSLAEIDGQLKVAGLKQPVQVVRDEWGVPHIYAQNTDDLFFAQGYVMAQDRLWEMEWWRRELEGRLAEVLGPAALERDRLARLLKFRGPVRRRRVDRAITPTASASSRPTPTASTRTSRRTPTPAGRIHADRHQAAAVDRGDRGPARAGVRQRRRRAAAGDGRRASTA